MAGGSPARPPADCWLPICILRPKNVPTVKITVVARNCNPDWVTTPETVSFSIIKSSTLCWKINKFSCESSPELCKCLKEQSKKKDDIVEFDAPSVGKIVFVGNGKNIKYEIIEVGGKQRRRLLQQSRRFC